MNGLQWIDDDDDDDDDHPPKWEHDQRLEWPAHVFQKFETKTPKHPSADWLCDPMRKSHLPRRSFALLPRRETCGPSPWSMRGIRIGRPEGAMRPAYGNSSPMIRHAREKHRKAKQNKHISIYYLYLYNIYSTITYNYIEGKHVFIFLRSPLDIWMNDFFRGNSPQSNPLLGRDNLYPQRKKNTYLTNKYLKQ